MKCTLFFMMTVLLVLSVSSGATTLAQEPTSAQVETTDGQTIRLDGPFTTTGEWKIAELTISNLNLTPAYIQQIERTADNTFILTMTDGLQVEASTDASSSLQGKGEWGNETVLFGSIQRIFFEGAALPSLEPPTGVSSAQIETTSGLTFRLNDFDALDSHFWIGYMRVSPSFVYIQALERTGDRTFTMLGEDGASTEAQLDEWTEANLSGITYWGDTTLPFSAIQRLTVESPPEPPLTSFGYPVAQIEAVDGQTVRIPVAGCSRDLKLEGQWEAFTVEGISFPVLRQLERRSDRTFLIEDVEGMQHTITVGPDATINGLSQWGEAEFPFSAIQRVTVSDLEPYDSIRRETVELVDGSSQTGEVETVDMQEPLSRRDIVERADEPDMTLLDGMVEHWLDDDFWSQYGFTQEDGVFTISCGSDLCPTGSIDDTEASLEFITGALRIRLPLSQIQRLMPDIPAPPMTPHAGLLVTVTDWEGNSRTFPLDSLAYTRYPPTCWSGWYSYDPFHWYTDTTLPVIRPDGSSLTVAFDRLARIEFPEQYDERRAAILTSTQGTSLSVTIYPGSTNEDTKSGPASWSPAVEGLLGTVVDGYQIYIPLQNVRLIELQAP